MPEQSTVPGDRDPEAPGWLYGVLTILVLPAIVAILYFAREVIIPVILAVLLSFLLAPGVRWLQRLRLGRVAAVAITVIFAFVAMLGFGAIVVQEVSSLAQELPSYRYNLETKVRALPGFVPGGGLLQRMNNMLRDLRNELTRSQTQIAVPESRRAGDDTPSGDEIKPVPVQLREPEPGPLQILQSIVGPLLQPLAISGLVVVFVIMILLDRENLRDRLLRLGGRGDLHRTTEAMDDVGQRISRYLRSQLIVNACCGLPIGVGLALIGIPNAALWGIMTLVLRFIPYLGIIIAAAFPLALAVAVAPGWGLMVWTVLLFVAIELVVSNLIEPWVYGDSTGISPVALIAAATFWTWLWGPIGLLLSTPMTVCLVVLGRHVPRLQFLDVILGNEPVLSPEETFYQRLLANDPEEATQQAEEFVEDKSLAEFLDEVAIPALAKAQADSDRGVLPAERRRVITQAVSVMLENLSDMPDADANRARDDRPRPDEGDEPVIVCLAGRNQLDETAALCLAHLLRLQCRAAAVQAVSADALAPDNIYLLPLKNAVVICISLISTGSSARARYLVRRVRRRAPQAKVIVGFWGMPASEISREEMAPATAADLVVSSLRDAVAKIGVMLSSASDPPCSLSRQARTEPAPRQSRSPGDSSGTSDRDDDFAAVDEGNHANPDAGAVSGGD